MKYADLTSDKPLSEKRHAEVAALWEGYTRKERMAAFRAAGFVEGYSIVSWPELRRLLPDMAEVLGKSILRRIHPS